VENHYYGNDSFPKFAPGLKSLAEATEIRNKVLSAFELAETEPDSEKRRALLTFVLIGGGATGVEMAGAIAELARLTMKRDFRRFDPEQARVVLIEGGPRLLAQFEEELSTAARERLRRIGVDVVTGSRVESIDEDGVTAGGRRFGSKTVIWCAGMKASPAAVWLGVDADRMGRVKVNGDLTVGADPRLFVLGDTAYLEQDGKPLPGVAQVALQQGRYAARVIAARLQGDKAVEPFRYADPGAMAVVGRNYAVMELGSLRLAGYLAWVAWSVIHVLYLALPNLRASVALQWVWSYLTKQRGSRLIVWPKTR
jgi:NADH dehydrogenase FAD-containing subunit